MANLIARWHTSINEITEDDWDILTQRKVNPFYEWNWLKALEDSESICEKQGWQPIHLGIWRDQSPVAFAPLYLKVHSYGEFIFDQVFTNLAGQLGLNYYPKLVGMSPLSPVEGYRFLYAQDEDKIKITALMMDCIDRFASSNQVLSCNFLYVDSEWSSLAEASKCSKWVNKKSLWFAEDSKSFSDYLQRFNTNQRKNIRKERKAIEKSGIKVSALTGCEISQEIMNIMHDLYEEHCARWGIWGSKYLSKEFFQKLSSPKLRNNIVLFSAHRTSPQNPIAMSLCVRGNRKLWGRYWGAKEEIKYLHFEVCYYAPIHWALNQGIKEFDPGAGGTHKKRRGFIAQENISMHRWYNKTMDTLINSWLIKVNKLMIQEIEASNNDLPFRIKSPTLSSQ